MADYSLEQGYITLYDSKSDQELRDIALSNGAIINAMPASLSGSGLAEAQRLLAEIKACTTILKNREEASARLKKSKENYKSKEEERKYAALQNLHYAVTANGQLVAAILEEESGKTQEEIFGWCDELSTLEQAEQAELLNGLVEEEIIRKCDDGRYELVTICTASLRPEPYSDWAIWKIKNWKKQNKHYFSENEEKEHRLLLYVLEFENEPMCVDEIVALLQNEKLREIVFSGTPFDDQALFMRILCMTSPSDKPSSFRIKQNLLQLESAGAVVEIRFDNGFNYTLAHLGTKEERK